MQTFILVVLILFALEVLVKIACLVVDRFPQRNKGSTAVDIVILFGLIVWGAVLLLA